MNNTYPYSVNYKITNFNEHSAINKAKSVIITNDEEIKKTKEYQKVKEIISQLIESGLTKMGEGYCISVSDIIFNLLNQNDIKCHLLECQLSIVDKKTKNTFLVGYNVSFQQNSHSRVSTHVVVVTDTEIPLVIDASIAHRLPSGMQVIIDKFSDRENKVFAELEHDNVGFIYQEKKNGIGIPQLHQISILERINTDKKIFKEINTLKILNYIGIFLSSFAMINIIIKFFID